MRSRPGSARASQLVERGPGGLGHRPESATPRVVQKWVRRYNDGGPDAPADRPGRGGKPRIDPAEHDRLRERIEAGPTPEDGVCAFHNPDVRRILAAEFGVTLGEQAIYDLLHRLGLILLMPRPIHRKADPEAQEALQKKAPEAVAAIAAARPGERVEVWFADEARFGQQGTLTRVWARRGSRPCGIPQTEYDCAT